MFALKCLCDGQRFIIVSLNTFHKIKSIIIIYFRHKNKKIFFCVQTVPIIRTVSNTMTL